MASRYEVEVKVTSAKDLKNVNWRHGRTKPYVVLWVDPKNKCTTRVDEEGDTSPYWDETLVIPVPGSIEDATVYIDVVHAGNEEDTKPIIGSARLRLVEILDDVGLGERAQRSLQLKRPSGRPHGKVDVKICVREPHYHAPDPHYASSYGIPPPASSRDYHAPPPSYAEPRDPYYSAPPTGYTYSGPPPPGPYGQLSYEQPAYGQSSYGQPAYGQQVYGQAPEEKKSKYGMGTGLAVGAVGGLLGGLAIAEGADYVEDKIADDAAEKVEDDLNYDEDDF